MTLGGANVWSNFSYGSRVGAPNGWLLNPQSSFLILLEKRRSQHGSKLKPNPSLLYKSSKRIEPGGLKNTRLHNLDSAFETWNELIAGGWTEVTNQFHESA